MSAMNCLKIGLRISTVAFLVGILPILPSVGMADDDPLYWPEVELWDVSGLSGYLAYSSGCEGEKASESLKDCIIELRIPSRKSIAYKRFGGDDFYFLQTFRGEDEITRVRFTDIGPKYKDIPRYSYQVHIKNGRKKETYPAYLNHKTYPEIYKTHPLLFAMSLAIQPLLQDHFGNYLTRYSYLNDYLGSAWMPATNIPMETLDLKGQKKNEFIVKLADYHSHGFRFSEATGVLDRVVIHDCKGWSLRRREAALKLGVTVATLAGIAYLAPMVAGGAAVTSLTTVGTTSAAVTTGTSTTAAVATSATAAAITVASKPRISKKKAAGVVSYVSSLGYLVFNDPEKSRTKVLEVLRAK